MEKKKNFLVNAGFYGIILALLIGFYRYIVPILLPFIIGFCVAAIVHIPLKHIRVRNELGKKWIAAAFCVLFYGIVLTLLILFGSKVFDEIRNFITTIPGIFQNTLYPFLVSVADRVQEILEPINPTLTEMIINAGKNVVANLGNFLTNLSASAVKLVANSAINIPGFIISVIVTVVSSFYIATDYQLVLGFLRKLIPEKKRDMVLHGLQYARTAVVVYSKSYSIIFAMTFLELWIGLAIMKIPYALGIAFGIAVFDLMPVLGTGGVLLPWATIALVIGNIPMGLGVLILYIVITIIRNAVEPRLVGDQIGLHPLATLVAMILGLKLMNLPGMLLFPISLVAYTNLKRMSQEEEKNTN